MSRVEEARAELVRLHFTPTEVRALDGFVRALLDELRPVEAGRCSWTATLSHGGTIGCVLSAGHAGDHDAGGFDGQPVPPPATGGRVELSVAAPYHGGGGPRGEPSTMGRMPSVYAVGAIDETDPIAVMVWTSRQAAEESAEGEVVVEYRPLPPPAAANRDAPPTGETCGECGHARTVHDWGMGWACTYDNGTSTACECMRFTAQRKENEDGDDRGSGAGRDQQGQDAREGHRDTRGIAPRADDGSGDVPNDRQSAATPAQEEGDRVHQPGAGVEGPQAIAPSASGPAEGGADEELAPKHGSGDPRFPSSAWAILDGDGMLGWIAGVNWMPEEPRVMYLPKPLYDWAIRIYERRLASERSARVAAERLANERCAAYSTALVRLGIDPSMPIRFSPIVIPLGGGRCRP